MKPLRDLVLVKPCAPDNVTEGGLFIPTNAQGRSSRAIVVEVGNGTSKIKMEAKVNDTVIHIKDAGEEIIINGEAHYLIRQNDILSYVLN
jgi:co-chaperonin GroES (HSP10)